MEMVILGYECMWPSHCNHSLLEVGASGPRCEPFSVPTSLLLKFFHCVLYSEIISIMSFRNVIMLSENVHLKFGLCALGNLSGYMFYMKMTISVSFSCIPNWNFQSR